MNSRVTIILTLILFTSLNLAAQKPKYKVIVKSSNPEMNVKTKLKGYLIEVSDSIFVISSYSRGLYNNVKTQETKYIDKILIRRTGSFGRGFLFGFGSFALSLSVAAIVEGPGTFILLPIGIPIGLLSGILATSGLFDKEKFFVNRDCNSLLQNKPELEKYLVHNQ
jgi:hypothetical protein